MQNITQVSESIQQLFEEADEVARQTKFIKRKVKVSGRNFAQTLVFGFMNEPKMSYRSMSQVASEVQLEISGQGLEQKFSVTSANFMKALLEKAIQQVVKPCNKIETDLTERFSSIHIPDGSMIGLPDECFAKWQGVRPASQKGCSAVKIHVSLEYKSGELWGPSLANGREHDKQSPYFCKTLQKGELRIADLGFFDLSQLEKDAQAGGFWITHYKHEVILYHQQAVLNLYWARSLIAVFFFNAKPPSRKDLRIFPSRLCAFALRIRMELI